MAYTTVLNPVSSHFCIWSCFPFASS